MRVPHSCHANSAGRGRHADACAECGKTVVKRWQLTNGKLTVTLKNQPKGRTRYTGSSTVKADTRRTKSVSVR